MYQNGLFEGDRNIELEMVEFSIQDIVVASMSQIMAKSNDKGIRIENETSEEFLKETLCGDSLRLQQVLADFLFVSVTCTPAGGQVGIKVGLVKYKVEESVLLANLEFRYSCITQTITLITINICI